MNKASTILLLISGLLLSDVQAQTFRPPELNVQFHRARTALSSGNSLLEAKARIDRVLRELPEDEEALKLRARVLMGLNRGEEALDDMLIAVRIDPGDAEGQLLLCETALWGGDQALARNALSTASKMFIEDIDQLIRLSACAEMLGETARAEAIARIAVAQNESDARGYVQLARIFVRTNQMEAARSVLQKLVENSIIPEKAIMNDPELSAVLRPGRGN